MLSRMAGEFNRTTSARVLGTSASKTCCSSQSASGATNSSTDEEPTVSAPKSSTLQVFNRNPEDAINPGLSRHNDRTVSILIGDTLSVSINSFDCSARALVMMIQGCCGQEITICCVVTDPSERREHELKTPVYRS